MSAVPFLSFHFQRIKSKNIFFSTKTFHADDKLRSKLVENNQKINNMKRYSNLFIFLSLSLAIYIYIYMF